MENEYFLNKLDHIVILGTGIDALRCTYELASNYEIQPEYYIVNDCKQNEFVGHRVFECDKKHREEKYVLVATSEAAYSEIQKQFISIGLEEFKDFIFYEWLFKKTCFVTWKLSFGCSGKLFKVFEFILREVCYLSQS